MPNPIYESSTMLVHWDSLAGVLSLEWQADTRDVGDEGFGNDMIVFAAEAIRTKARAVLVDVNDCHHSLSEPVETLWETEIVPRYNQAGVTRVAFVFPSDAPPASPHPAGGDDGASFETRYFNSHAAASAWLAPLHITVAYRLADDADTSEVLATMEAFVERIRIHHPDVRYLIRRDLSDERGFQHIITVTDSDALKDLQGQDFFKEFGDWLSAHCASGPNVSRFAVVATTG
ncbi:MAG: hypothetical protein ACI9OJ_004645 [Myxococcota bacterium]|jgi:hypothetical protein